MLADDLATIIGIVTGMITISSGGIWVLIRNHNGRMETMGEFYSTKIDELANSFREDIKAMSTEHRQNDKELGEQLHSRISEHAKDLKDFQLHVAKYHPERPEIDQRIDSAIQPMIREVQSVRDQVTALNSNLTQFMRTYRKDEG